MINSFVAQQQNFSNICAVQKQPVNSASEYNDLRSKLDKVMVKINSTKLQHQEDSKNPTPYKPKGNTKKDSWTEGYDKYGYPIIYYHTHGISCNLTHDSMK